MELSQLNFSEQEEAEIVRKQFEEAWFLYQRKAIPTEPVMCQLHEVFETFDSVHHNCLGCNFAESTWLINNFLQTYKSQYSIQYAYSTFIILAYLLVERIDTLFDIIELDKDFRRENFKVLLDLRRWANFLKHPKAFLLTHHPTFSFSDSPKNKELIAKANVIVDRAFLDKYYAEKDEKKDQTLYKAIENKDNILVIFPNVISVTENLCQAMKDCVSIIRDNAVYRWILEHKHKTTFRDYWIDNASA